MSDISKLPKWAQELLRSKDAEIRRLQKHNDALRATVSIPDSYGNIRLTGYGDEPLPVGLHFRLEVTRGPGAGLDVSCGLDGELTISAGRGRPAALSRVSNVMVMRRVDE